MAPNRIATALTALFATATTAAAHPGVPGHIHQGTGPEVAGILLVVVLAAICSVVILKVGSGGR